MTSLTPPSAPGDPQYIVPTPTVTSAAAVCSPQLAPALPSIPLPGSHGTSVPEHGFAKPPPPISYAESLAEEVADAPEPTEPVPKLLPMRPLRIAWIAFNVLAFPVQAMVASSSPGLATLLALALTLPLAVWSAMATLNVERARSATAHHHPPSASWAAASWFVAPAFALAGTPVLRRLDQWVEEAPFDDGGGRALAFVGVAVVFGLGLLLALYQPYRVLGRASRWVSGDGTKFRRWFVAPLVAAVAAGVGVVLVGLMVLQGSPREPGDTGLAVGTGAILIAAVAPWLAWLICGSRAMVDLEEAVGHQHRRRTQADSEFVMPLNPTFTAQAAARPQI